MIVATRRPHNPMTVSVLPLLMTFLGLATTMPAATLFTNSECGNNPFALHVEHSGGGPGSSHAECSATGFDRGHNTFNTASADVSTSPQQVAVTAYHSDYRFAPLDTSGSAFYQNEYAVTLFGDPGFGIFVPCLTASGGGGGEASATAQLDMKVTLPPEIVQALGSGNSNVAVHTDTLSTSTCDVIATPPYFFFEFGKPLTFSVALNAFSSSNPDGFPFGSETATFLYAFSVSRIESEKFGIPSFETDHPNLDTGRFEHA